MKLLSIGTSWKKHNVGHFCSYSSYSFRQLYKVKVGILGKDALSRRKCADPGVFVRGARAQP